MGPVSSSSVTNPDQVHLLVFFWSLQPHSSAVEAIPAFCLGLLVASFTRPRRTQTHFTVHRVPFVFCHAFSGNRHFHRILTHVSRKSTGVMPPSKVLLLCMLARRNGLLGDLMELRQNSYWLKNFSHGGLFWTQVTTWLHTVDLHPSYHATSKSVLLYTVILVFILLIILVEFI